MISDHKEELKLPLEIVKAVTSRNNTISVILPRGNNRAIVEVYENTVVKISDLDKLAMNELKMYKWFNSRNQPHIPELITSSITNEFIFLAIKRSFFGLLGNSNLFKNNPDKFALSIANILKKLWSISFDNTIDKIDINWKLSTINNKNIERYNSKSDIFTKSRISSEIGSVDSLLTWLDINKPTISDKDIVISHGNFRLSNMFLGSNFKLIDLIDFTLSGIADKNYDIAILFKSIEETFGTHYWGENSNTIIEIISNELDISIDKDLMKYYQYLDEIL